MYTLRQLYSASREQIIKSIGVEWSPLDIKRLRLLLIHNMKVWNLLDPEDKVIVYNPNFWTLFQKYDNLDDILAEI